MYFVSRQHYFYSSDYAVEVAKGGIDYAGADMLSPAYKPLGEFQEYSDPREAASVAVSIAHQWQIDRPEETILISFGNTHGIFTELESAPESELLEWAIKEWESLEKCPVCGEIIHNRYTLVDDITDETYCSEYCAEKVYYELLEDGFLGEDFDEDN